MSTQAMPKRIDPCGHCRRAAQGKSNSGGLWSPKKAGQIDVNQPRSRGISMSAAHPCAYAIVADQSDAWGMKF
jgi:hypothetical protein